MLMKVPQELDLGVLAILSQGAGCIPPGQQIYTLSSGLVLITRAYICREQVFASLVSLLTEQYQSCREKMTIL